MRQHANIKGFTLLELIAVLAISGILLSLAVPAFTTFLENTKLSGVAQQTYSHLQLAKNEAIKQNTNVYFSTITGSSWCYGIKTNSACTCTTPSGCNIASSAASGTDISLSRTGFGGGSSFYFEPNHGNASNSGTITYTVNTKSITISVNILGGVSICSSTVPGYNAC